MIIKDEIYGTIECSELEKKILDSKEFQRLHRIKQMAFTYLVYPGATHTRFEHCLGTMSLASTIAEKLGFNGDDLAKLRLFALLHDLGHVAFSHESEYVLKQYLGDHEEIGRKKLMKGEIADILKENFSSEDIIKTENKIEGKIITSDLGADRMDYLMRDARNTGVAYGVIDVDRITHTLSIVENELVINENSLASAESLLIARFMMFSTVYLHKTVRIAAAMLRRAILTSIENNSTKPEDFLFAGDEEILLKMNMNKNNYANMLLNRKLYKTIYDLDVNDKLKKNPEEYEKKLSEYFKTDIILDCPTNFFKPVEFKVKTESGLKPIYELSEVVKALETSAKKRNRILVLCPERDRDLINARANIELKGLL